ncbi:hypothetical protein KFK09_004775 [Dendrobium nobile]|uniref:CCHC-type domain-containing protein n=1 Tax=Dendrobium nobile TaxID=94219 RepID=A0A8T3BZG1_DENNO|nr:hypothetical protein KFK09_004775 [Dendrobium nobile]
MVSEQTMTDQGSSARQAPTTAPPSISDFTVPAPLKFLISNLKNLVPTQLTADNYTIWRLQLFQHFTANGFAGHLTGSSVCPSNPTDPNFSGWNLIDKNLISALLSTISTSISPYVISSSTAHEAWITLEKRLQSASRSRVIQLKNELHQVQMKESSMQQYLAKIKSIVDTIAASGSNVDQEDIIIYILNGLPAAYNSFKTSFRTSMLPIDLDTLYSLMCSEEIHVQREAGKDGNTPSDPTAFYSNISFNKSRNNKKVFRNKNTASSPSPFNTVNNSQPGSSTTIPICQICGKQGHVAIKCWHRCNPNYAPTTSHQPRALLAQASSNVNQEWVLDSGASTHITPDVSNINYPSSYRGSDVVSIANGSSLPIHNTGQGILPIPDTDRKLHLSNLLHVPSLKHNLLSVSKLTADNSIRICFDANGFTIKDMQDHRPLIHGRLRNGLYQLQPSPTAPISALQTSIKN